MKKIILTIAAVVLAASVSFGQDLADAFQVAKDANEAWTSKNYTQALAGFQKALSIVEACEDQGGDQGKELIGQCKNGGNPQTEHWQIQGETPAQDIHPEEERQTQTAEHPYDV